MRKYFYGHKTKKDVELPADFPIPGWGLTVVEEPSWLKALHDSYDSPLGTVELHAREVELHARDQTQVRRGIECIPR